MTSAQHHLSLRSTFDELERAVEESEAFFAGHFDDPDFVYNLVLLTSEAVTNAIEHGNRESEQLLVQVRLQVTEDSVLIVVEDEGEGFNPENVDDPLDPENIFDDGGRGVFLMESLADEVEWSNQGRKVTLTVRVPGVANAGA